MIPWLDADYAADRERLLRRLLGWQINQEYVALAKERTANEQLRLPHIAESIDHFCNAAGAIDWEKLVAANSGNYDLDKFLP